MTVTRGYANAQDYTTKERQLQSKKAPIDKWMLKSVIIALW